jgi:hypothetical protein
LTNKDICWLLLLFTLSINYFTIAQNSEADVIIGTWLMPDDEGIIRIYKDGGKYNGKILWMKETEVDGTPLKDKENPEYRLQNREVAGLKVMTGFNYIGNKLWSDGTFYAARKGIIVEPDFELIDNNHLNICVSILFFTKTINLTRVDSAKYFYNRNKKRKEIL